MIHRGVSLYSYQQHEFFHTMTWKDELREVATNLRGADGTEIISECTIPHYPFPPESFFFAWRNELARWGLKAVTMDCYTDTLQFRDHVLTYGECAERLERSVRGAVIHRDHFQFARRRRQHARDGGLHRRGDIPARNDHAGDGRIHAANTLSRICCVSSRDRRRWAA